MADFINYVCHVRAAEQKADAFVMAWALLVPAVHPHLAQFERGCSACHWLQHLPGDLNSDKGASIFSIHFESVRPDLDKPHLS